MSALCQAIHVFVQVKKKTHHAMRIVLIMMGAMNVNVQMAIKYTKRKYALVSYVEFCQ